MFKKGNKVEMTNQQISGIKPYRSNTPWYCKKGYWGIVLGATVLDWVTLFALYDLALNGNFLTALVTAFGVTTVLDLYSCWLPNVLKRMNKNKKNLILGGILLAIIMIVAAFSVAFRLTTGNISTSSEEIVLTSTATSLLNFVLGLIPIASTIALLYLSVMKDQWDEANIVYRNEQMLIILNAQKKELDCSQDDLIKLSEIDQELYDATVEVVKAHALRDKLISRIKIAEALGDSESAEFLSKYVVVTENVIETLQPKPINTTETV